MKKIITVLCICLLGTLSVSRVMGQVTTNDLSLGMPELNLLSSLNTPVSLVLTTAVAGEAVLSSISDENSRLKISSIIAEGKTRTISAKITAGGVPAGTTLTMIAMAPNTNFGGTPGILVGTDVTLSTSADASIISAIGSCYSGTTGDDGYKLKYTWGLNNPASTYGAIRASAGSAVTITLTLSAGL